MDRSLGAVQVPKLLREAGFALTTLAEHYGEIRGQRVADTDWIELTAERGWIAFHKDKEIRRNEAERLAVLRSQARLFCVPRADLTSADMASRFLVNLGAIAEAAKKPGPYIYSVQVGRIVPLPLG